MAKLPNVPVEQEVDQLPEGPVGRSEGLADLNESVGREDRSGKPKSPMSDGPRQHDKTGAFLPARYKLPEQEIGLKNGEVKVISGIVREDR